MIRRAEERDIPKVTKLLSEVLEIHASIRPDIFVSGKTKYTKDEIKNIFADDMRPVYVYVDEKDEVQGYAFCEIKNGKKSDSESDSGFMINHKIMYIDDLCVDQECRGKQIGKKLFDFVKEEAKRIGCYEVTLCVWEGNNSARKFYEKIGMKPKETVMEYVL